MREDYYTAPESVKCPTCNGKGTERVWAMGKYRGTIIKCTLCNGKKIVNSVPRLKDDVRREIRVAFTSAFTPILVKYAEVSVNDLWDQAIAVFHELGSED